MNTRSALRTLRGRSTVRTLRALGVGVTTVLVVAVLVIEALDAEFSALVGFPVGLLAGLLAGAFVLASADDVGPTLLAVLDALTAFGFAVLVLLGARYVDLAGLRSALSTAVIVALATGVAALVLVAAVYRTSRTPAW